MANQPAPVRPWSRLLSIARPAPPQAPAPTPTPDLTAPAPPPPPRPATQLVRPAFRPTVGTPAAGGASSLPTSPVSVGGGRGSQPSSPADKKPITSSSVPNSPVRTVTPTAARPTTSPPKPATTASVPSSPAKPVATTASLPTSPATKPVATTTTASVPTSPAKPVATTASVPTSPAARPAAAARTTSPTPKPPSPVTFTTRVPSPTTLKPAAAQSPVQSPKIKPPTAPPPSPLTLPPSQLRAHPEVEHPKIPLEAEQKTVLFQTRSTDKPKPGRLHADDTTTTLKHSVPLHGKKEDGGETKEKAHRQGHVKKFASDSEDGGMRVITISGENKGAFMELIRSPHNKNGIHQASHLRERGNFARNASDGSDYQSYSSSSEESDGKKKEKSNKSKTMPLNAYMNSNVQGVNNSIVYNSSCSHHDPGVHLSLLRKPTGGGFHVKERTTNGYNS